MLTVVHITVAGPVGSGKTSAIRNIRTCLEGGGYTVAAPFCGRSNKESATPADKCRTVFLIEEQTLEPLVAPRSPMPPAVRYPSLAEKRAFENPAQES